MRRIVPVVLALLVVGACGSDDPGLSRRASRDLEGQIDLIEYTMSAGEWEAARRGVDEVRRTTEGLAEDGGISPARTPLILAALDDLDAELAQLEEG